MNIFGTGKAWIKAPITGTAILVCYTGSIVSATKGDLHGILLFCILADVIGIRRDKYIERFDNAGL